MISSDQEDIIFLDCTTKCIVCTYGQRRLGGEDLYCLLKHSTLTTVRDGILHRSV